MKKNFEVAAAEMLNCAKQCASADPCAPETLHQDLRQKMMHSTNNLRNLAFDTVDFINDSKLFETMMKLFNSSMCDGKILQNNVKKENKLAEESEQLDNLIDRSSKAYDDNIATIDPKDKLNVVNNVKNYCGNGEDTSTKIASKLDGNDNDLQKNLESFQNSLTGLSEHLRIMEPVVNGLKIKAARELLMSLNEKVNNPDSTVRPNDADSTNGDFSRSISQLLQEKDVISKYIKKIHRSLSDNTNNNTFESSILEMSNEIKDFIHDYLNVLSSSNGDELVSPNSDLINELINQSLKYVIMLSEVPRSILVSQEYKQNLAEVEKNIINDVSDMVEDVIRLNRANAEMNLDLYSADLLKICNRIQDRKGDLGSDIMELLELKNLIVNELDKTTPDDMYTLEINSLKNEIQNLVEKINDSSDLESKATLSEELSKKLFEGIDLVSNMKNIETLCNAGVVSTDLAKEILQKADGQLNEQIATEVSSEMDHLLASIIEIKGGYTPSALKNLVKNSRKFTLEGEKLNEDGRNKLKTKKDSINLDIETLNEFTSSLKELSKIVDKINLSENCIEEAKEIITQLKTNDFNDKEDGKKEIRSNGTIKNIYNNATTLLDELTHAVLHSNMESIPTSALSFSKEMERFIMDIPSHIKKNDKILLIQMLDNVSDIFNIIEVSC